MTVSDDLNEIKRQTEREVDVLRDHLVAKLNLNTAHVEQIVELYRRERETVEAHHHELHTLESANLEEFKTYVREQIVNILRALDTSRAERASFVSRDTHDSTIDSIEKSIVALEKSLVERYELASRQLVEKHDSSIKQTTEKHDLAIQQLSDGVYAKIGALSDRITKMEQGVQVMNARNQQSIIALGVLLTAVEVLIRFFTS